MVLLVDDEPDILDALQMFLESELPDIAVTTAPSGAAGLEVLKTTPVDVIVADYKMAGMDGLQFLAEARVLAKGVPRILMTAFPDLQLAIRAVNQENIRSFFTKPLDPPSVVETLRDILAERHAEEARQRAFARSFQELRRR